ncbi:abortive infection protein, AbiV family [Kaistia soli DSM 19436]|uniref:Abortive infection protein, AbiV family n=1 Tax=Kaistia soli DSM 19436 TaxID=1122133 RepID=A0A1M4YVI2_9HYPH|nr:AbiV family abortive infection protein [Kaistia soli]SHF09801.1 abortive infection protein, AbiV family [Kaistia soli DSM 19436]
MNGHARDPLHEITINVESLLRSSRTIHDSGNYALSTHVSILCIEESAKYLLVYCKAHLPHDVFRKRFQHVHKHAVSNAPWFLAGQFSVAYMLHITGEMVDKSESIRDQMRGLSQAVTEYIFQNDPQIVAEAIASVLAPKDAETDRQYRQFHDEREKDRVNSIYVDVSDDLVVTASPRSFGRAKSKEYVERAELCAALIQFLANPTADIVEFVDRLPPKERLRIKREGLRNARTLIARLRAAGATPGTEGSAANEGNKS